MYSRTTSLGTLAVAGGTALLVCLAPTASAIPPVPLAPQCQQFIYPTSFIIKQDDGVIPGFNVNGNDFSGTGASKTTPKGEIKGRSTGGLSGHTIVVTAYWNDGSVERYIGDIGDDLVARGTMISEDGTRRSNWYSLAAFRCVPVPAPAPAPPPPAAPAAPAAPGTAARVTGDVDAYDKPGGSGTVIGQLDGGRTVRLLERKADNWCHVSGDGVPGGDAWVWGDYIA